MQSLRQKPMVYASWSCLVPRNLLEPLLRTLTWNFATFWNLHLEPLLGASEPRGTLRDDCPRVPAGPSWLRPQSFQLLGNNNKTKQNQRKQKKTKTKKQTNKQTKKKIKTNKHTNTNTHPPKKEKNNYWIKHDKTLEKWRGFPSTKHPFKFTHKKSEVLDSSDVTRCPSWKWATVLCWARHLPPPWQKRSLSKGWILEKVATAWQENTWSTTNLWPFTTSFLGVNLERSLESEWKHRPPSSNCIIMCNKGLTPATRHLLSTSSTLYLSN